LDPSLRICWMVQSWDVFFVLNCGHMGWTNPPIPPFSTSIPWRFHERSPWNHRYPPLSPHRAKHGPWNRWNRWTRWALAWLRNVFGPQTIDVNVGWEKPLNTIVVVISFQIFRRRYSTIPILG
jgi:hypothetical protein